MGTQKQIAIKHTLYILFIIIILAFSGCKKDDVQVQEFKIISESVYKNTSTIVITVYYTYVSVLQSVDGYISESYDMTNAMNVHGEINKNTFVLTFNDLHANTTYYYYYEYSNGIDHLTKSEIKVTTTNDYGLPTVITNDVTDITANSAKCGGDVTKDGESEIIARGVCYGLNENPTIDGNHTIDSMGFGSFSSVLVDLSTNTTYYVRAYATNQKGTSYGEQKSFITTDGLPTVTTKEVTDITATTATCGGIVVDNGGFAVTARGVCYSTSPNPTIDNSHTNDSVGSGSFISNLSDLSSYTTYYVRAYAINSIGIKYGDQKSFTTKWIPVGNITGIFSVNDTDIVYFSKGNLQYKASTNTWRFAENQWDYVGGAENGVDYGNVYENGVKCNNALISQTYNGWIDLFGWGTSGYDHGAVCYQPYSTSTRVIDYYAYGSSTYGLNYETGKADLGYNRISNGGNIENVWRTLTTSEWKYILDLRVGIRYAKAIVNNINGLIILPDDWSSSYYTLNNTNVTYASFNSNVISATKWETYFEVHGAVFLPASGGRNGTEVYSIGSSGTYWSSSGENSYNALYMFFHDSSLYSNYWNKRYLGFSVRLVCDVE